MANQPYTSAAALPSHSASAIPFGLHNESSSSHTLVANSETKGMTGTSNSPIFIPFWFCQYSSLLAT
jgi:hypothetical protein